LLAPYLSEVFHNEAKSNDSPEEDWEPSKMFGNYCFGFIGGGKDTCAFVGNNNVKVSSTCCVSRRDLEEKMRSVTNQGEGERMIISSLYRTITMGFAASDEPLDCCVDIHCEDTDMIAGLSTQLVHSLVKAKANDGKHFAGAILIRGHSKSVNQIMKLGKAFRSSLGISDDCVPTGNGFIFQIDPVALYYCLEQNNDLGPLPPGHRAASATCAAYALINNDYNGIDGLGYTDFFSALKSKELRRIIETYGPGQDTYSPVILDPVGFTPEADNTNNKSGLNLCGILAVFGVMMVQRKNTRRLLGRIYSPSDTASFFPSTVPYDVVRGASLLACEPALAPDPIAILARLSCCNFVLKQWMFSPYVDEIVPALGKEELAQTAYDIPSKLGRGKECLVDYSLVSLAKKLKGAKGDVELVRSYLERNRYGSLFTREQLVGDEKWLFLPLEEVMKAIGENGLSPSVKVSSDLLLPTFQASSMAELGGFIRRFKPLLAISTDREHGASCIQSVFELTLCSRTEFNPANCSLGPPLLTSKTPVEVSTGGFKDSRRRWNKKTQWPGGCDSLVSLKIRELFAKVATDEGDQVLEVLMDLCEYIFSNSSDQGPLSRLEDRVIHSVIEN